MHVSSITDSRRNMFIRYANHFMGLNENPNSSSISGNETEKTSKALVIDPETENKPKGIETLTTYSIFPKQVINGKTIITA